MARKKKTAELYGDTEAGDIFQEVKDTPTEENDLWKFVTDMKFDESKYISEVRDYILDTYKEHYSKGKVQTFELIVSAGQADGFTMGNIMKYASRYGKKDGYNRSDLMKIIHYALLQLYVHDLEGRE